MSTLESVEPRHPLLVNVRGASDLLGGIDTDTVRMLVRTGELDAIRIESRPGVEARKLHVLVASIEAYVERQRVAQQEPG
jgi:hypothetical protein